MTPDQIKTTLDAHRAWLAAPTTGARADLRGVDLRWADLREANLRDANLRGAVLSGAVLSGADLCGADLCGADLREADLRGVDLREADLRGVDLRGVDLRWADLRWADLREGLKAGRNIGQATRGDSYVFHAFETDAGELFFFAGCRTFLRSEFEAHIEASYPGTPKAAATRGCLDYLTQLKEI